MAYKKETISNIIIKAIQMTKKYSNEDVNKIKIALSKGNKKIGRVLNVSMMPVLTCGNCKECKGICYDIKACVQYPNVLDARIRNTILAKNYREIYFGRIDDACSRRKKNKFFRWHVAGDILDMDYLCKMIEIAIKYPDFKFWTYTKMYGIVNNWCEIHGKENIPQNLTILFSEWKKMNADGSYEIVPYDNRFGFPIFSVRFKGEEAPNMHRCPGNCDICKANGHGCPNGESSYVDEH